MGLARNLLIATIILGGSGFSFAAEDQGGILPELPAAIRGETCVEPLDVMRRDHMTMLFHQRDRTMYQGERSTPHSLTGCLSCHTQKDSQGAYIPINAPGQFCESCHSYASVKIDCFGCHATRPLDE
jgi:hypothetical protein